MSLHDTIRQITNELISIYAVLDSWCDDGRLAVTSKPVRDNVGAYLILNARIVSCAAEIVDKKVCLNVPDLFLSADWTGDRALNPMSGFTGETLRARLRDQLFDLLCFLDRLKADELPRNVADNACALLSEIVLHGNKFIEKQLVQFS